MLGSGYKLASDDIVFEEFEGELVVLNLASGRYFGFNNSAATVWGAIMAGVHPVKMSSTHLDEKIISEFVKRLISFELIETDQETNSDLDDATLSELKKITSAPTVEVYEDLADLIIADPIHDVDNEEGWPVRPESS